MADSSRAKGTSDKLEDVILKLTNHQISLGESMQLLTLKFEELLQRIPPVPTASLSLPPLAPALSPTPASNHRIKLDVPRFDGTDPLGWIFKINQFFRYHGTLEHDHLTIASFYMEGRALAWFQWMTNNGQFTSWSVFLQALQTRFLPSQYEDPTRALFKLTQKGSVAQYLSDF